MLAAAGSLGGVKRQIGIADEAVGAGAARIADSNSDGRADQDAVPFDDIGTRHLVDEGPRKRFQQPDVDYAGKDRLELVAAEATDLAVLAHNRFQPLRHLPQKLVADRVPQRIVDVLEAIEVDQEKAAAFLPMRRVPKRFFQCLPHHRSVRKAGERVKASEA